MIIRQSHVLSAILQNNCTHNNQKCTRLCLVQLLDCYWYNYSLIKCNYLYKIYVHQKQDQSAIYSCKKNNNHVLIVAHDPLTLNTCSHYLSSSSYEHWNAQKACTPVTSFFRYYNMAFLMAIWKTINSMVT